MDEIEWLRLYNSTVSMAERVQDGDTCATIMNMLKLMADLNSRVVELSAEEDDE